MKTRNIGFFGCVAISILSGFAYGAPQDFDFKDPKGVNSISFLLDSPLEPILGLTAGISGSVKFDPADPKSCSGKIVVDAKSLHFENKGMKDSVQEDDWLDVKKFPKIEFAIKQVKESKSTESNVFEMVVVGDMTCKGITQEITVPVRATYLPGKLGERMSKKEGDLLALRSKFTIKRKDFNIKPTSGTDIVSDEIQIGVSIVGWFEKK